MPSVMELERLITIFMGDARGLLRECDRVESALKRASRTSAATGNVISRTFTMTTNAAQQAANVLMAVADATKYIALGSIKASMQMEVLESSFKALIGNAEESTKLLADLSDFALKSPFITPQLMEASIELAAFGRQADEILPDLKMIGDIARGDSKRFSEMVYIYGKIIESGRLYQRDINQLAIRGVPVYIELAKMLGLVSENAKKIPMNTYTQIRRMVQEGQINADMVHQIFQKITSPGGLFFGQTEQRMKTLSGVVSNVEEHIVRTMRRIGDALVSGMNLKPFFEMMDQMGRRLDKFFATLTPQMKDTIRVVIAVTAAFLGLTIAVTFLGIAFNLMFGWVGVVVGLLVGAIAATSQWVITIGGLEEAWYRLERAAKDFWESIKPILPLLTAIVLRFLPLTRILLHLSGFTILRSVFVGLLSVLTMIARPLAMLRGGIGFLALLGPLGLKIAIIIGLLSLLAAHWNKVQGAAEDFYTFVRPSLQALWSLIKTIGFGIRDLAIEFQRLVDTAVGFIGKQLGLLQDGLEFEIDWSQMKTGLRDFFLAAEYGFLNMRLVGRVVFQALLFAVIVFADEALKHMLVFGTLLIGPFILAGYTIKSVLTSLVKWMASAVPKAIEAVFQAIQNFDTTDLDKKILGALIDGAVEFGKAGDEVVEVIKEIKKAVGKVEVNEIEIKGNKIPLGFKVEGMGKLRGDALEELDKRWKELAEGFPEFREKRIKEFLLQDLQDDLNQMYRVLEPILFGTKTVAEEAGKSAGYVYSQAFAAEAKSVDAVLFNSAEAVARITAYTATLRDPLMIESTRKLQSRVEIAPMPHEPNQKIVDVLERIDQHIIDQTNKMSREAQVIIPAGF